MPTHAEGLILSTFLVYVPGTPSLINFPTDSQPLFQSPTSSLTDVSTVTEPSYLLVIKAPTRASSARKNVLYHLIDQVVHSLKNAVLTRSSQ